MSNKIIALILTLYLASCANNDTLEKALDEACNNRIEFLKVLEHYGKSKNDSLKLESAKFIITNMSGHYYKTNTGLKYMTEKFKNADSIITDCNLIKEWWLPFKKKKLDDKITYDLKYIKAEYLIDNIDQAYTSWINAPWHEDVTFSDFCNYILPYRFEDEPIAIGWRDTLSLKYKHIIGEEKDVKTAFAKLKNEIWKRTEGENTKYPLLMDALTMQKQGNMNCRQGCVFLGYIARSLGIPVVMDQIFQWANYSKQGHNWIALTFSGKTYTVTEGDTIAQKQDKIDASYFPCNYKMASSYPYNINFKKKASKIYRHMFCGNEDNNCNSEKTKWKFQDSHYIDVSEEYHFKGSIKISAPKNIDYVYLCTFWDSPYWAPVTYKKNEKSTTVFNHLGDSIVYLPMYCKKDPLIPLSNPILITGKNKTVLNPINEKKREVTLTRKYPFSTNWTNKWGQLIGSKFEASNDPFFHTFKTLYTIKDMPTLKNVINISNKQKYRYIRYKSNPNNNFPLAEIQIFGNQEKYKGSLFGKLSYDVKEVFNGKFYKCPNNYIYGYCVGMDLGDSKEISKIIFYPKNDGNFIIPNMEYELFYYDFGWVSLGKKQAKNFSLIFKDVPQNALLLLRNKTEGNEERIFTYENGEQKWW